MFGLTWSIKPAGIGRHEQFFWCSRGHCRRCSGVGRLGILFFWCQALLMVISDISVPKTNEECKGNFYFARLNSPTLCSIPQNITSPRSERELLSIARFA